MLTEQLTIQSDWLKREVVTDCYLPVNVTHPNQMSLLLINDGQNMQELGLGNILDDLLGERAISPVFCAAIHAGEQRKMEYGTAGQPDYEGRGAKAGEYTRFVLDELLSTIRKHFHVPVFKEKCFAGFSIGALSALDIVWNNPHEFSKAGVFSGSLWWRTKDITDNYNEATDRIMHARIREGAFYPWLKFFFECGTLDETMDRNQNGVIDSIDDTLNLITELETKGYELGKNIYYLQLQDGRHDIATWARAMPKFLKWGWGL